MGPGAGELGGEVKDPDAVLHRDAGVQEVAAQTLEVRHQQLVRSLGGQEVRWIT